MFIQYDFLLTLKIRMVGVTKEGRLCYKYRDGQVRVLVPTNPLARVAKPVSENIFSKKR